MSDYRIIILSITTFVIAWLGLIGYKRSREHIAFSIFVFSVAIWSATLSIFYLAQGGWATDFWARIVYVSGSFVAAFFYQFARIFADKNISRSWRIMIFGSALFLTLVYLFTDLFIKGPLIQGSVRGFIYGPARPVFDIYFDLFFVAGFLTLYRGYRREADLSRRMQYLFFIFGTLVGTLLATSTAVFLPIFNNFEFLWTSPIGAGIWVAILTYGIARHHLLNIRVIATEIFVSLMWFILFINTFTFSNVRQLIFGIVVFLIALIVGYLLIRSVIREVEQKEKLETLTVQLEEANVELKKLDAAKSEFISIASHQLRAPLTVIKGYVSLIMEGSIGKIEAGTRGALDKVSIATDHLVKLINDLLDLSRMESGKIRYEMAENDFIKEVEEVVREYQEKARQKNINFSFQNKAGEMLKFVFDKEKIHEVILNLIDNAFKYSRVGGQVRATLENLSGKIRFSVKDDGIGVSPEDVQKLFGKFARADNAKTVDPGGMGIGLYFVKKVIEDHRGSVGAESEGAGKGSTFWVELPLKSQN